MKDIISISNPSGKIIGTIELPGSKSGSNRALIINALTDNKCKLQHLSESSDTLVLQEAIASKKTHINIGDAGTAMRFLIAYYAATGKKKILTGCPRMLERPVGPLVDALNTLGSDISYCNKHGFPPVNISPGHTLNISKVAIPGNVSSQFISALLMIAPTLPNGLVIEIEGKISSMPYIGMTLQLMQHFGIACNWSGNTIAVGRQDYNPNDLNIESDWSSASYWYAMAASVNDPAIFLKGLRRRSFQGDAIIQKWTVPFGIISEFSDTGVFITRGEAGFASFPEHINFTDNPDIAQTIIVLCAANNVKCRFMGIESLRIKETDRIQALQNELAKFGVRLIEISTGIFNLEGTFNKDVSPIVETYGDHRMAMAFAQLALYCKEIKIKNPLCVNKSYPRFWDDCTGCGFEIGY